MLFLVDRLEIVVPVEHNEAGSGQYVPAPVFFEMHNELWERCGRYRDKKPTFRDEIRDSRWVVVIEILRLVIDHEFEHWLTNVYKKKWEKAVGVPINIALIDKSPV